VSDLIRRTKLYAICSTRNLLTEEASEVLNEHEVWVFYTVSGGTDRFCSAVLAHGPLQVRLHGLRMSSE
jgi:hypothetical protein